MTTNVNDSTGNQWKKLRVAICLGWWGFVVSISPQLFRLWQASARMAQDGPSLDLWRVRIVVFGAPMVLLAAGVILTRLCRMR